MGVCSHPGLRAGERVAVRLIAWFFLLSLPLLPQAAPAPARIAIVLDDMGARPASDPLALELPLAVALSFLPHATRTPALARAAQQQGREILIHLPMQAVGQPARPGQLTLDMDRTELEALLRQARARLPQAMGLNNHQGSLATRHPALMAWLMEALDRQGLWFLDSRTTAHSLALHMAQAHELPSTWRDVFLDHDPDPQAIDEQFRRLLQLARRQGSALAIGHPRPATLAVLRQALARLPPDIRLVAPSQLLQQRSTPTWQAYLSPSQKAARKWKPSPSSTCCAEPTSR